MSNAITKFKGDNFFLSNFYVAPVVYQDVDMCAGDRVEVPRRLCSEVSVCNIFCKIV